MMKPLIIILCCLNSGIALADDDWRKTAPANKKIDNLIEVMPGASNLMLQMGERYRNLYWAGKQGKWDFAAYQIEEMQDLIETLMITRPKRSASAKAFAQIAYTGFPKAIENKDWQRFAAAFDHMREQCMICHNKNDHAFIVLSAQPQKGNSPVLD